MGAPKTKRPASEAPPQAPAAAASGTKAKPAASAIDDIFGVLGAKSARKARATPAAPAPAGAARGSKRARPAEQQAEPSKAEATAELGRGKRARPSERVERARAVPSAFAPPHRSERVGWVDDGFGGVHDGEGWTGRKTEEGFRIFKTRLLQPTKKKESGGTPLCPFDCDCCYV